MHPSNHSSLSSPPQSASLSDIFPFDEFEFNNEYQLVPLLNNLGTTLPTDGSSETILINNNPGNLLSDTNSSEFEEDKLQILGQPKAFYRERYPCEIDPKKKRAQRYIRTEDGNKFEHPTIKVLIIYLLFCFYSIFVYRFPQNGVIHFDNYIFALHPLL